MARKKGAKKVPIHIRVDEDIAKEFKRVVEQQGYTQTLIITEMIKEYLKENKQPKLL